MSFTSPQQELSDRLRKARAQKRFDELKDSWERLMGEEEISQPPIKTKPSSILREAQEITDKNRQDTYGPPEDNFKHIGGYWDTYLSYLYGSDLPALKPKDVAMMMTLLKIAREDFKHSRDNLTDACGYLRCASKIEGDEVLTEDDKV